MELKKNQISCPQKKWQKSYYATRGTVKTAQTSQTQKLPEPDRYEIGRVKALLKYLKDFVYLGHERLIPTCFVFEIYDNRGKFIGNAFPDKYFLEDGQLVMTFSDVDPRQYFSNRVWSDEFFGLLVQGGIKSTSFDTLRMYGASPNSNSTSTLYYLDEIASAPDQERPNQINVAYLRFMPVQDMQLDVQHAKTGKQGVLRHLVKNFKRKYDSIVSRLLK